MIRSVGAQQGEGSGTGVDESGWPVVVVSIGEGVGTEDANAITAQIDELVSRGERMGLVFDYQRGEPEAVQIVSSWLAREMPSLERVVAAGVTVVRPESLEGVQEMIDSGAFSLPFPCWATATVGEGRAWVAERLANRAG